MLNIYKNKGISLIELMVAVGLGLILVLSMLAFYSISSQNVVDFQQANRGQQQIRKIMNLLETDIENTGGFECAKNTDIFTTDYKPSAIISLGDNVDRKQIVFVHPIIDEYQHSALGQLKFNGNKLVSYTPRIIGETENIGCGQDNKSTIYVGATILEMIPMKNIITTDSQYNAQADNVMAFVALSAVQSRREKNSDTTEVLYTPRMEHATVMFLSDEDNTQTISTGKNTVDIFLGFSPAGKGNTHVPDTTLNNAQDLLNGNGGWINPFSSDTNNSLLVNKNSPEANLLSQTLHNQNTDKKGFDIKTYPLKGVEDPKDRYSNNDLIGRVRAIKFQFTFGVHGDIPERKLTRVIRFKNTHLNPE